LRSNSIVSICCGFVVAIKYILGIFSTVADSLIFADKTVEALLTILAVWTRTPLSRNKLHEKDLLKFSFCLSLIRPYPIRVARVSTVRTARKTTWLCTTA